MTDAASTWNVHHKSYVDPAVEKSAFIIFVEFCSDTVINQGEVAKLAKQRWSLKPSIFHLSHEVASELAQSMGIDASAWARARGADLLGGRPAKRVLVGDLRYCRSCLAVGNHSTLFQLPQVVRCPIHDERLRTGCPHCGQPINTNAFALARNHLYCGDCDRNLATDRRRSTVGGPAVHPSSDDFTSVRRAILHAPLAGESRSILRWDKTPAEIVASSRLVRVYHAHSVWGDPSLGRGFLRFRTETFRLDEGETPASRPKFFALVRSATITAFENLAAQLGWRAKLNELPAGMYPALRSSARVDLQASTVAAAYWRAAAAFDVVPFVLGEMPPPTASTPRFHAWLPEHTSAMRLVVGRIVQSLFVRILVSMRRLRYGVQVAWLDLPEEALFLVPWRLRAVDGSDRLELQIRTLADGETVERLASRYRRHWLLKAPDDVSLLGLVTGSTVPEAGTPS